MQIPHQELEPSILRKVVAEFVTRDGTDISSVEARIEAVLKQLEKGRAELHYDADSKTCNILSRDRASD
ncbi:MAG: YheU family protein [Verrucomicrobiales bacterium]|nr:YheU family protein [Verrucomicrobiales bacterium]